jgi:serine/threonine protein kinase
MMALRRPNAHNSVAPPTKYLSRPYAVGWWDQPEDRLGTRIDDRLRLERVLGKGGYAISYLALDESAPPTIRKQVVVKMLYIRPYEDACDKIRRFKLEAAALDALADDPGFAVQVDRGRLPTKRLNAITPNLARAIRQRMHEGREDYYIVLQYLSGGTLWDRIRHSGPLAPDQAVRIVCKVAKALSRAHRLGILHRDVTPANVLFDREGSPKLIDLGLAYFVWAKPLQHGTRPVHRPLGTPGYIPPESYRNKDTYQRDVYSLGITLIECLTGHLARPRDQSQYAQWRPIVDRALARIQPPDLRAIAQTAVAQNPAQRYPTMDALRAALSRWSTRPGTAPSYPPRRRPAHPPPRVPQPRPPVPAPGARTWQPRPRPGAPRPPVVISNPPSPAGRRPNARPAPPQPAKRRVGLGTRLKTFREQRLRPALGRLRARLATSKWQHALVALPLAAALRLWLAAWPEFYGSPAEVGLPLVAGVGALFSPGLATALAALALLPLIFSLSPLAGLISLTLALGFGIRICFMSRQQRRERLFVLWLFVALPQLSRLDLALAVPLALAGMGVSWLKGAGLGALSYVLLAVWATLRFKTALGPTMIYDPTQSGLPWITDLSFASMLRPPELLAYLDWLIEAPVRIWGLVPVLGHLWAASPAPAIETAVWALAGAATGWIAKKHPTARIKVQIGALCAGAALFAVAQIVLLYEIGLAETLSLGRLLGGAAASALVASGIASILHALRAPAYSQRRPAGTS